MAGSRNPGPAGHTSEVQDLHDGTTIRGLSPCPGPVGVGPTGKPGNFRADTSGVNRLLQRLRDLSSGVELQQTAVALLGRDCFSAGVIVGIGIDIFSSAKDLLKLVKTFVLADLHDTSTYQVSRWQILPRWWQFFTPALLILDHASRLLVGKLAKVAFGEDLRKAAEERDELVKELGDALRDPKALFEGLADQTVKGYQNDWKDFNTNMKKGTLEGQFRAGMIFGEVLVDILSLLTGVAGLGKAGAKLGSKLPRLVKYAKSVKLKPRVRKVSSQVKLKPRARKVPSRGGGSGGSAKTPSDRPVSPETPHPSRKKPLPDVSKQKKTQSTHEAAGKKLAPKSAPVPGRVQSRINVAKGPRPTRFTPRRKTGEPVSAGWDHVEGGHFNRPIGRNRSVFAESPSNVKSLLQNKDVVNSPVRNMGDGHFERVVDVGHLTGGKPIGTTSLKQGGVPTTRMKILTDEAGNLVTAYPVK